MPDSPYMAMLDVGWGLIASDMQAFSPADFSRPTNTQIPAKVVVF